MNKVVRPSQDRHTKKRAVLGEGRGNAGMGS
jgi:hypothetical protein